MKRKPRSDRNHIIYRLTAPTGEFYIGMTCTGGRSARIALRERWKRHVSRAIYQGLNWPICEAIRAHGAESFKCEVLLVVRGKAECHRVETELIRNERPTLNLTSIKNTKKVVK